AVIRGVRAHADALRDEHVLGRAVGGVAGELAKRTFRLADAGEDFAFDHDFGTGRHFEVGGGGAGEPIGVAVPAAGDLEFPHVGRIGVDHRAHVVDRMDADGDDRGQRLALFFGAAVIFVHAPARVQRYAEAVLALEHEAMEAGAVDAGDGIAGGKLAAGDV